MKKKTNHPSRFTRSLGIAAVAAAIAIGTTCQADNPTIQTIYTADPAPVVRNGVCYLYVGHDEDVTVNDFFTMKDWRCFTSTDMVNWTDHGVVATLNNFGWAGSGGAWAMQCIERNGKWYMYCTLQGGGIGVLVANSPFGPFTDPIGRALIDANHDSIDPTVFVDNNGQAYLSWGNPKCWYVKLNNDMISYDVSIGNNGVVVYDMTVAAFGQRSPSDPQRPTSYEEGPWLYQRNALYYLIFVGGPLSEHIGYSTGPSPTGPWTYRGVIMAPANNSFTIHPGVVDLNGKTYLFYHNGALPGGGNFRRSVCVDEMQFNPDGSIQMVQPTTGGPAPVATLNPYQLVEAETICWESGVETEVCSEGGMNVSWIENGDYIKVKGVDFGAGATSFDARVASASGGGNIEIRLDSLTGPVVGTCSVVGTGGWQTWATRTCPISGASGVHDVYLRFTGGGGNLFNFNWWRFTGSSGGPIANGTYRIIARHSGKGMDAYNQGTANGTQIQQWPYWGGAGQKWTVTNQGNNQFSIIGVQSGKAIEVSNWGTANGTKVQLWDYLGGTNQKYTFTTTSGGYYRVTPVHATGSCLDVAGISTADGALVHLWTYGGGNNQQWAFQVP
jgi:arabinoxylan arabinofuranohydrolase